MDRLTSMAVFVKAVDLGSFAAAAEALALSGPMVGKHVRHLEDRLGVVLIARTTRRQSLTEFGRAYYDRCRVVLAEAEAADALAADQLAEPRGRLRVSLPVHFGRCCAAPVLLALAARHPALELDLSFSDRFVDLADGDHDFVVRTGVLADRAGLIARRLARQQMVVCDSPAYVRAHGQPLTVTDLGRHQAILYRRSGRLRPWLFPIAHQPDAEVLPPSRLRLDDLDAIAEAAVLGMGLAWLPLWLVRPRLRSAALIRLLPEVDEYRYDVHALWLQTPKLPLKVRLAVDALAAALPGAMG